MLLRRSIWQRRSEAQVDLIGVYRLCSCLFSALEIINMLQDGENNDLNTNHSLVVLSEGINTILPANGFIVLKPFQKT